MKKGTYGPWIRALFVLGVILAGIALGRMVAGNEQAQRLVSGYGYVGVFLVAFASGFNVLVPVPTVAFFPALIEAGLDVALLIPIITAGVTLADVTAYFAGRAGREIPYVKTSRVIRRLEKMRERWSWAPPLAMFFWASIVPFPNETLAVPMGLMGYKPIHVIPSILLGNAVFNTFAALFFSTALRQA